MMMMMMTIITTKAVIGGDDLYMCVPCAGTGASTSSLGFLSPLISAFRSATSATSLSSLFLILDMSSLTAIKHLNTSPLFLLKESIPSFGGYIEFP